MQGCSRERDNETRGRGIISGQWWGGGAALSGGGGGVAPSPSISGGPARPRSWLPAASSRASAPLSVACSAAANPVTSAALDPVPRLRCRERCCSFLHKSWRPSSSSASAFCATRCATCSTATRRRPWRMNRRGGQQQPRRRRRRRPRSGATSIQSRRAGSQRETITYKITKVRRSKLYAE